MAESPYWDYRRSIGATRILVEVATERGLKPNDCLNGTSITLADLSSTSAEIEASEALAVVRNVVARLDDPPGLGVEVGRRFTLGNYGLYGLTMVSCPTLGSVIAFLSRNKRLSNAFSNIAFEESGAQVLIRFDSTDLPPSLRNFLLERDLSTMAAMLPAVLGNGLDDFVSQCHLDLELNVDRGRVFETLLPTASVKCGQRRTALRFPRSALDYVPPQANAHTAELLEAQCRDLQEARSRRRGLAEQVRSRLLRDPGRMPSMAEIAAEFHIDPRTLRRRLGKDGTSFRALVEEARAALSPNLLKSGLSVEEAARQLGYTETSSFSRAFTRWHGVAPSHYLRPRSFRYDPC